MAERDAEPDRDFRPSAQWTTLKARAALLRRLRAFFERREFVEVETPVLSADSVVDRYLDPFFLTLFSDPQRPHVGPRFWLQTSPEFHMKRLLAAGADRIFQVTRAFRAGEQGRLHNPEFTMVEWYRVGDSAEEGRSLLADLACELLEVDAVDTLTYGDAFQQFVGLDPHRAPVEELAARAVELDLVQTADPALHERDSWLNLLLGLCVEPQLGRPRPTILYDYPAGQAALAVVRQDDPPVAERFELYYRGVELANGYHELQDPDELRRRNRCLNQQRKADGKYLLPEASRLLAAMEAGLPACSGTALGFDRLVMLALEKTSIEEVLAFPASRA